MSIRRRSRPLSGRPAMTWLVLVVSLALLAGAWWFGSRRSGARPTPPRGAGGRLPRGIAPSDLNLLLITLDTTRADRIGAYGWTPSAPPNLERIAAEGVVFEHAPSPAPLTLPAHSSLFTAKSPPQHGVRDNG